LIREEMTKAFDHNARRYWVLNVGDIKPAEWDIDYFLQLAWNEPKMAPVSQQSFLEAWAAEQFPAEAAPKIAEIMRRYYALNFVRKPEFMGFNGYTDPINRTAFNPLAWGDQNRTREDAWQRLREETAALGNTMPREYQAAFFELVSYPVEAAAEQNEKFLMTDRSFLDASRHDEDARKRHAALAQASYDRIQQLTAHYNTMLNGKWDGMMSAAPRNREVFKMPRTATAQDVNDPLPKSWGAGSPAQQETVSINAAHYQNKSDGDQAQWRELPELGISGASMTYGEAGLLANETQRSKSEPWLEYDFETTNTSPATLTVHTLPTFAVDSAHRLRYAAAIDGGAPVIIDASVSGQWSENTAPVWAANVLRNSAEGTISLGSLAAGPHTLKLIYQDPGVVFEHLVITFAHTPPAYPVPPDESHSH
jgi:hypothetical protein